MRTCETKAPVGGWRLLVRGPLPLFTAHGPFSPRFRSLIADPWLLLSLCLPLAIANSGCRLAQKTVDVPGQTLRAVVTPGLKGKTAADPVGVQQSLLQFADEYATRMAVGVDKLQRGTHRLDPAESLKWKLALETETFTIASGPNAVANLLDMTIFVTATRMSVEEQGLTNVFGNSTLPMLESCRSAEAEIWQLAGTVLKPEQQAELHKAIRAWHQQNPLPEDVLAARALDFTSQIAAANKTDSAKPDSVFNLLQLDPLSGLDPAVREITQTRLFAERALFVIQKMPMLLRWQTELLSVNAIEMPAVRQLVTNSTQIAASAERFASVAEKLPGQVSAEREEILKALRSQEKEAAALMTSGTQMSDSLNTTLTTFDALMKRFGVGETNNVSPSKANDEPFRIQDYTATAAQLEATLRQLTELLVTLDKTIGSTNLLQLSAQVGPVLQQAQTGGKQVVDYAFGKGVLLVAIVLVAGLVYRLILARLMPANVSKPKPL